MYPVISGAQALIVQWKKYAQFIFASNEVRKSCGLVCGSNVPANPGNSTLRHCLSTLFPFVFEEFCSQCLVKAKCFPVMFGSRRNASIKKDSG